MTKEEEEEEEDEEVAKLSEITMNRRINDDCDRDCNLSAYDIEGETTSGSRTSKKPIVSRSRRINLDNRS
jgi:D-Tyr-tRNAtyr deacylase